MKRLSIGPRILLGFGAIITIVAALGAFTFWQLHEISRHSALITSDCLPGINLVGQIDGGARGPL